MVMPPQKLRQFQVIGRKAPTESDPNPPAYRMKLFSTNEVLAKSRFWYHMHSMRKMKKTTGEILAVNEITEKNTKVVNNYGIWIRYNSRSGTHNMFKEYRCLKLTDAVEKMYTEMAGRHRARRSSIQIINTGIVPATDCRRTAVTQMHSSKIKFPLPHRVQRAHSKRVRSTFLAKRPSTFQG